MHCKEHPTKKRICKHVWVLHAAIAYPLRKIQQWVCAAARLVFRAAFARLIWMGLVLSIMVKIVLDPTLLEVKNIAALLPDSMIGIVCVYAGLSVLCALTLVPSMPLVFAAALSFPHAPLNAMMLACVGVLCSSVSIYWFTARLGLSTSFQARPKFQALRAPLERYGAPLLALWALCPFTPTDIGCYVAASAGMQALPLTAGPAGFQALALT